MSKKVMILIQELEQVSRLKEFLTKKDAEVVVLRADVEEVLKKEKIKFTSVRQFISSDATERLKFVESLTDSVISNDNLSFWSHRNIHLFGVHRVSIQDYLLMLTYWMEIISRLIIGCKPDQIFLWESYKSPQNNFLLSDFYIKVVDRALIIVANHYKIDFKILPFRKVWLARLNDFVFESKRTMFSIFLLFFNSLVKIIVRPKSIRILVSDLWKNTSSYIKLTPDNEYVFIDRMEFFKMKLKDIFNHRILFLHPAAYSKLHNTTLARKKAKQFRQAFFRIEKYIVDSIDYHWNSIDLSDEIISVIKVCIEVGSYKDVKDMEDIKVMLEELRPSVVVVRASASNQTHFSFLSLLAKQQNIPSVESQHGWFYFGPSSIPKHSVSSCMATYGDLSSKEFKKFGYKGDCVEIGSPRFDIYENVPDRQPQSKVLNLLIVLYDDMTGTWTDTYDIVTLIDFIQELLESHKEVNVTLKARPNAPTAQLGIDLANARLSKFINFRLVTNEPIETLLIETDLTISVFSTIVLESMIAGRPVIYFGLPPFHKSTAKNDFMSKYIKEGGIEVTESVKNLTSLLDSYRNRDFYCDKQNQARKFIADNFYFKHGSSKRFADLLERLSNHL